MRESLTVFLLAALFFLILTPIAFVLRLLGMDFLEARFRRDMRGSMLRPVNSSGSKFLSRIRLRKSKRSTKQKSSAPETIYPLW